jgi:hypothetical protein
MVSVQALAASALVAVALRAVLRRLRLRDFAAAIALLTLGSSLPYFVSFLMPDVFLGLAALAAVLLLFFVDRLGRLERWGLGLFLGVSLTFHATNPPAILVMVVIATGALMIRALPARPTRMGIAIVGAGLLAALAAGGLYPWAVGRITHMELSRPPFLAARLLADGPGRRYLRAACVHGSPFVLCNYRQVPMTDANDILWGISPKKGVFEPAPVAARLAMTHEEPRFVAAVIAAEPLVTLWDFVADSGKQLALVSIVDTLGYSDRTLVASSPRFAPPFGALRYCVRGRTGYCYSTAAQLVAEDIIRGVLIVSAAYLVLRLALSMAAVRTAFHRAPLSPRLMAASCAVAALILVNAVICGALSGAYPRYEMRVMWLVPLFALFAALESARPGLRLEGADDQARRRTPSTAQPIAAEPVLAQETLEGV